MASTIYDEESFFEIHITVNILFLYYFKLYCNEFDCKYDYATGPYLYPDQITDKSSNNQLMYTRTIKATYQDAINLANKIKRDLEEYGVKVVRVKLEVPANHKFVQKFAKLHPNYGTDMTIGYYEFHFKVLMVNKEQHITMSDITKKHVASFSYNAFGKTPDKVLVAQRIRCDPSNYDKALELRQNYIDDMIKNGLQVDTSGSGVHYEFVVYDDNKALDDGFVPEALIIE